MNRHQITGAGLGLRRGFISELQSRIENGVEIPVDFFEVAPENWLRVGGRLGRQFRYFTERYPFACHGLSLSIGSPAPLDEAFVRDVKGFLEEHKVAVYSEHLSYCSDDGHLYDLMPLPFTEEAVKYVSERIMRVQDILGERLVIENVSAYVEPGREMAEPEFVRAVLEAADCELLLDVNNVYVNSTNHGYDAEEYIRSMPSEKIRYYHVAGHYQDTSDASDDDPSSNLLVDTHGADVIEPVWALLSAAYDAHGMRPTLLERDFNFPDLDDMFAEVSQIKALQEALVHV
ncbi:hypothetical protein SAMN05421686_103326 [Thalassolituus maritimus]|uniref:UPF0276 protein SAMN05421686_103326 n=1 Tax=Thalassolituus maritimus TaxID=484498 RepID=A0A1N7L7F8_9GAMM|nr:DUF692 domain-containing protein [Thalassolituus maritimus]SIS69620.1 hypothetical protein SAMN05421686_103326 [Thalassolituus maritimus]